MAGEGGKEGRGGGVGGRGGGGKQWPLNHVVLTQKH